VCRDGCVLEHDEALRFAAGFVQAREIGLHLAVCLERGEGGGEDSCCAGIGWSLDAVVHPLPFPPRANDSGVAEIGQMPGYLWLTLFQNLHEVADTYLAAIQKVEQPESRGVCQRGKQADKIKRFRGAAHIFSIYALTDI